MGIEYFSTTLDVIEQEEPWLFAHMERVAMFAYALGKEFEVSHVDKGRLYDAGFLHGLGEHYMRIYMHKANADEERFKAVEAAWPLIASAMISTAPGYDYVAKLVAQCAENFDGSGEPFGAKKYEIHVYAAMLRIADLYDTLRMNGVSHDGATAELRKLSGKAVPKKLITPFLKTIVNDEDLKFDYTEICSDKLASLEKEKAGDDNAGDGEV